MYVVRFPPPFGFEELFAFLPNFFEDLRRFIDELDDLRLPKVEPWKKTWKFSRGFKLSAQEISCRNHVAHSRSINSNVLVTNVTILSQKTSIFTLPLKLNWHWKDHRCVKVHLKRHHVTSHGASDHLFLNKSTLTLNLKFDDPAKPANQPIRYLLPESDKLPSDVSSLPKSSSPLKSKFSKSSSKSFIPVKVEVRFKIAGLRFEFLCEI